MLRHWGPGIDRFGDQWNAKGLKKSKRIFPLPSPANTNLNLAGWLDESQMLTWRTWLVCHS